MSASGSTRRDERLDLFRGLALICIFVDHMPGNWLGLVTLRSFGFSDAAEVFVFVAGYTAVLAYSSSFVRSGFMAGVRRIALRIRDLYAAHLLLTVVCAVLLAMVARWFENPLYYEHVNLTPFSYDPLGAIWRALVLYFQLGYLNILPLYMVLLAWLPVLWWLAQRHIALPLAASGGLWLLANTTGVNLPSWPERYGWYFNPFAWQLLFSLGAVAAVLARRGVTLPRSRWLVALAAAYLVFAFIVAAPWVQIAGLEQTRLIHPDWLGPNSKSRLSLWRLAHILSLAYMVALYVPAGARCLASAPARFLVNCGKNSLDIFCIGTVLSFVGFAVMLEGGRGIEYQLAVNGLGFGLLGSAAWWLTQRKQRLAAAARLPVEPGGRTGLASVPLDTQPH